MKNIKIGDRVKIKGDTQHFILVDPEKTYGGKVIGMDGGQLLVSLDKPVIRGTIEFREVSVPQTNVLLGED
jgi:hypothetical protein